MNCIVLLNLFVSSNRFYFFGVASSGFFTYKIMSSVDKHHFTFSFPIWMAFVYFSCLIALCKSSSTILKEIVKKRHFCFFSYIRGKGFGLSSLSMAGLMLKLKVQYFGHLM